MKRTNKNLRPESQMMSYGYNPFWSEGAIKPPIFQTSTFEFASAEAGKKFFAKAYGKVDSIDEPMGLIYSRINNPNLEILEHRLSLWDQAEACAFFESGMAAISTAMFEFIKPDSYILCGLPCYGGTQHFVNHVLVKFGVKPIYFYANESKSTILKKLKKENAMEKLSMIFIETPTNPTLQLFDIELCAEIRNECKTKDFETKLAVDNTFLGPIWQHPLQHGADLILYSATKYIGGHSDVVAGACLGSQELINRMKIMRTFLGNMASPHTAWLLTRSLETLKVRMEEQAKSAKKIAKSLRKHPQVERVFYLDQLKDDRQEDIFRRHCSNSGAIISFHIKGGEKEAFSFLNNLTIFKLAVSLGGTESLAEHPATMTHTDMSDDLKEKTGVNDQLIRLSIGLENVQDLIEDIEHAFEFVKTNEEV